MRPTTRVFIAIGIACALLGISFFLFSSHTGDVVVNDTLAPAIVSDLSSKDSDNDGLTDWEEALWKTDPQNPDTDGDGTLDGEEVLLGRDPRKPGPNDFINAETETLDVSKIITNSGESETEKLAQTAFVEYLELKNAGVAVTPDFIANSIARQVQIGEESPSLYTVNDVKTTQTNDVTLRVYAEEMGQVLIRNESREGNELQLLQKAVNGGGLTETEKIAKISTIYAKIASESKQVIVPSELLNTHVSLVNTYMGMQKHIFDMSFALKDPLRAVYAVSAYQKTLETMVRDFNQIAFFYNSRGISFEQGTGGYLFLHAI